MRPVSSSGISFHHMTRVFPPAKGGVTPGDAVAGPADFAAWLTSQPASAFKKMEPQLDAVLRSARVAG